MALRGRGFAILGTVGAVGASYYLYTAGGDVKVANKNIESTQNTPTLSHYSHESLFLTTRASGEKEEKKKEDELEL